jgi:uncharacterized membrane protein
MSTGRLSYGAVEDRTMPAVVYALYLLGIANGLTVVLGLVLALFNRNGAGARMRSHYTFLIRTCWLWLAWMLIGALLILFGFPLSRSASCSSACRCSGWDGRSWAWSTSGSRCASSWA